MKRVLAVAMILGFSGVALAAAPTKAVAVLSPTKDSTVKGVLTFTKTASGVSVSGEISGLKPGTHGFHIHEFGDCTAADGASAVAPSIRWPSPTRRPPKSIATWRSGEVEAGAEGVATIAGSTQLALGRRVDPRPLGHLPPTPTTSTKPRSLCFRLACGVVGVARAVASRWAVVRLHGVSRGRVRGLSAMGHGVPRPSRQPSFGGSVRVLTVWHCPSPAALVELLVRCRCSRRAFLFSGSLTAAHSSDPDPPPPTAAPCDVGWLSRLAALRGRARTTAFESESRDVRLPRRHTSGP